MTRKTVTKGVAAMALTLASAGLFSVTAYGQSKLDGSDIQLLPESKEELASRRAKAMQALKPVCRDRQADIKAHRKPKRFNAFLLDFSPKQREDIKLMCDSM